MRVHARRIGPCARDGAPHRRQIDDRRHAGEVLHQDAPGHERDRERGRGPGGERRDVGVGDVPGPGAPKQVLEEDLQGVREPRSGADPLLGQPGEPIDVHDARIQREG